MESPARIGASIRIKGEVISREPLSIAGVIDGTIDADGHPLTIEQGARLDATITAQTVIIAGQLNGTVMAGARIAVHETAAVEGELSSPAISVAEGATVQGRIETSTRKAALSLAS
jgi:cytoskeletal protein CcmA (bactofilin family)